jgi:5-methyltetrahydrofolate--homocysteine methyltransferase
LNANDFASSMKNILLEGANIIGGCCGTTPEHINKIFELKHNFVEIDKVFERFLKKNEGYKNQNKSYFASRTKLVNLKDYPLMLGERINPNALKKIREAIKNNTFSAIVDEARLQIENGADMLDINISVPNIDEPKMMKDVVSAVSKVVNVPFCIDSPDYRALESGLKYFCGKALVNSVNGEKERIEKILPIVKKYGASVIALTIDENGIPDTVDGRLKIAEKIIKECAKINIGVNDIFVDALVLTISTNPKGAKTTLETIRQVKKEFGVRTILGLSNISFGLPGREVINSNFLAMAIEAGLDIAITNPNNELLRNSFYSSSLLCGYDIGAERYINSFYQNDLKDQVLKIEKVVDLKDSIIEGLKDKAIELVIKELEEKPELEIINKIIIPALDVVGAKYEKGEYFLPQLLMSAETAQAVSKTIQDKMEKEGKSKIDNLDKTIVFATVKGDLHDIGKNIVISVLKNYSYNVIDLGKSISNEVIIEEALKNNAKAIGLSALMTTTMQQMSELINILEKRNLRDRFKVFVGGAVVTEDYAKTINADGYGKDATDTVNLLRKLGI